MMHINFYHWHSRAELKPDTAILEARWNAAKEFSKDLSGVDVCNLLRMALFVGSEPDFAKRFSEAIVTHEPTFLPEGNAELLRVMATAALYSKIETQSAVADAVAMGLTAAAFPPSRVQPICKELSEHAAGYLAAESERVRPAVNLDGHFSKLKEAVDSDEWAANAEATTLLGDAVLTLGEALTQVSEENQFLWWLLGRRSPLLNIRREKLATKEYAFIAAHEAAQRVTMLPPPRSAEALIVEVLTQCPKFSTSPIPLNDLIEAANLELLKAKEFDGNTLNLTPIMTLLKVRNESGKVDAESFENVQLSFKLKVSSSDAAIQFFREEMFLRSLKDVG